jgi:putative transposase
MLAALIRPIVNASGRQEARDQLSTAVAALEGKLPKVAAILEAAEEDVLAFYAFPADHWRKLRSTNPLERLNGEIGRRTDVVGIFPDDAALIRLTTMLCIEQNDDWLVGRRYLSAGSIAPKTRRRASSQQPDQPNPHRRPERSPLTPRPGT